MPEYTFVVISYQIRKLVCNALEAFNHVKRENPEEFEVILVDDGSTDGTARSVMALRKNYPFRYLYQPRGAQSGRSACRNLGAQAARGRVVVFVDGDIIVRPEVLSELNRCYQQNPGVITGAFRYSFSKGIRAKDVISGRVFDTDPFTKDLRQADDRHTVYDFLSYNINAMDCPWMMFYTCFLAVPLAVIRAHGGLDENFRGWGFEDTELSYRYYKAGVPFIINPRLHVYHQYHGVRTWAQIADNLGRNIDYTFRKHPELRNELPADLIKFYVELRLLEILAPAGEIHETRELVLDTPGQLEYLKNEIVQAKDTPGLQLDIMDHCEQTGLDLWVQQLGRTKARLRYFPASYKLNLPWRDFLPLTEDGRFQVYLKAWKQAPQG